MIQIASKFMIFYQILSKIYNFVSNQILSKIVSLKSKFYFFVQNVDFVVGWIKDTDVQADDEAEATVMPQTARS